MIKENDRIKDEFYLDQVMQHCIDIELKIKIFEMNKSMCQGTPKDYEEYENTLAYWHINDNAPYDFSLDLFLLYQTKVNNYQILEVPVFLETGVMEKQKATEATENCVSN